MGFSDDLFNTIKSCAKIALGWRPGELRKHNCNKPLLILANGPSLNKIFEQHGQSLTKFSTMAVNFAANSPQFKEIKPDFYILVDPHFFIDKGQDENVDRLWENLNAAKWNLTVLVPRKFLGCKRVKSLKQRVESINAIGAEGFGWFTKIVYSAKMAMPRPRNVLIPAIMSGIWLGFHQIVIVGADHSWMKTISVNDNNEIISIQPHFYKESKQEEIRVRHEYQGYRLHEIVGSFAVAFKSYHDIASFAAAKGISIINSTPESFIDAFPRKPLSQLI